MAKAEANPPERARYAMHPCFEMEASSRAGLLATTGRSLDDWTALVRASGPSDPTARTAWLRREHGLGLNYAGWIAEHASDLGGPENYRPEALVDAMFTGPKAALRPLYERLLDLALALGDDVRACPGKTIVPLYRRHVFAQLKPATRTRIDLGLALRDAPVTGRLVDTGGLARRDRITRRIAIADPNEIDDEVVRALRTAYDLDATVSPRPGRS